MNKKEIKSSPYEAEIIAEHIIKLAYKESEGVEMEEKEKEGISNLKLQKMLYFVQAYFLATLGRPAFEEDLEAWKHGPVVEEIYHKYKEHGSNRIPLPTHPVEEDIIQEEEKKAIEDIWTTFGGYTATALLQLTHDHDPWQNAMKSEKGRTIHNSDIKKFYSSSFKAIASSLEE